MNKLAIDSNCYVIFGKRKAILLDRINQTKIGEGLAIDGLYSISLPYHRVTKVEHQSNAMIISYAEALM